MVVSLWWNNHLAKVILTFTTILAALYVFMYGPIPIIVQLHNVGSIWKQNIANSSYSNGNWTIIAFSDSKYVPTAQLWYQRLSDLGYTDHVIGTLDKNAYDKLKSSFRVHHVANRFDRKSIWKVRMEAIQKLLKKGKNVVVSDVDSIWLKQVPFRTLENKYDAFYAHGTTFPRNVYDKWGFVLCCCFSGYRSNNRTIALLDKMLDKCYNRTYRCDDQLILNNVYATDYDIEWKGQVGYSQRYNFTVYAFDNQDMQRGKKVNCDGFIISPGAPKTNEAKIEMWKNYTEKCGL